MITTCTVIVNNNQECLRYMLESLEPRASIINQILICDVDLDGSAQDRESKLGAIPLKQFRYRPEGVPAGHELGYAHALGLHACIDQAKNDYVMFIDHDVIFFRKAFDQLFVDLYEKHNLTWMGVEHSYKINEQCYLNFPTVITGLAHKSKLPGPDFLQGQLKFRDSISARLSRPEDDYPLAPNGKFLLQTPIPSIYKEFPNPDGNFDIGCNLWHWLKTTNGRWLTFRKTLKDLTYSEQKITNFGNIPGSNNLLLFHSGMNTGRRIRLEQEAIHAKRLLQTDTQNG